MHFARNWIKPPLVNKRHLEYIAQFTVDVQHVPGKDNIIYLMHCLRKDELHLQPAIDYEDLKDCSHVFVHTDSVLRSLQPPYHGPYKVINRSDKVFTLFLKGKNVNVSIHRLKPCFSDNSSESDIESSIGEDTPNKPAEMPEKKIRFA
ncbi:uncharacterized protein TNIN_62571 [Trichonephila inaurata madagascariensis]|uniref:Uncharacterized protein n=1 Tax=Trichonephila inaurata madagascariensis TaxID=2747483 RepID=A0A8X6XH92_9ARAC|nr:uncharacterized protein TNIN_62571 [Trichonephila inaurata madagascariensis]